MNFCPLYFFEAHAFVNFFFYLYKRTPTEMESLDRGLEVCGKSFTRISREFVCTRSTSECIERYYATKHRLKSTRMKQYRKRVEKEDEAYIKYLAGLGRFVAVETKRLRMEKVRVFVEREGGGGSGSGRMTRRGASTSK
jgi:UDP-galactopyranose mutase